jgi:diguanylate cyclase (GGDEF)-like protein
MADRWAEPLRRILGLLILVLLLGVVVIYATGQAASAFEDLGEMVFALLASLGAALAARQSTGRLRSGWIWLSMASLSWGLGEAIWSYYELVKGVETPFPSLADLGFLGFPMFAVVALALFPSGASRHDRRRMALDGMMVATAIGLFSWATALGAVVGAGGDSTFATAISVAYPLSDIALLVLCILVLSRSTTHRAPLVVIAAGLGLMAVADSGFAYVSATETYDTGSYVDLGWFLAFGLLALAPVTRGATTSRSRMQEVTVAGGLLPYIPLAGAVGFLGYRYFEGYTLSALEAALAVVLGGLVLIRQFLTVRDNQQLATALAGREAELRHQAFHDGLTGLANRALYVDRVAHALELHRRDRRPLAMCFVDLDGFKAVNDTRGHAAGDELLRQVADRFRGSLSDADTLARLGGDEFAVLLEDGPAPLEVGRALLSSLSRPFLVGGHQVSVLASVGVAKVDGLDETPSVDELLRRADVAMYVVKRRGKADVQLYSPALKLDELDEMELGAALSKALREGHISVLFQPIVDLATGQLHTLEALARWAPGGHPVPPDEFIKVAERCGLVDELFEVMLDLTCAQLARWSALPGGGTVRAAVNLNPRQLSSPDLVSVVVAGLHRHGLTGRRLVLEITESEGLTDTPEIHATCADLRALGVRLSVDDFGLGLSSLARLRDLPIDEIKIDRSFIKGVDQDSGARRFVRGVLAFATETDLIVIAEGVERVSERNALTQLGCHRAQGFLFSRPVLPEVVDDLLSKKAVPAQAHPG